MLPLPGDDEVLRALVRRRDTGVRDDGHCIALVVSGGGMRGVYAGGMAHALDDAGLGGCFDVVYGSSAGAYIGGALLLGDGRGAAHIFFEDMACRAFVDPRRLGSRRPMVSLDHLLGHILTVAKPMSWERLRDSPVPLRVVATAADDLTPHVLEPRSVPEWRLAMRATAAIPVLAGPAVRLHGRRWIDGSVAEPLPVLRALRDGATHVLALLNRTLPELRATDPGAGPARWARALDRLAPGLGAMAQESARHGPSMTVLDDAAHPSRTGAHLLAVLPGHDVGVRGLTIDPARVERAARVGYAALQEALERVDPTPRTGT
ncbi:patatin-like phospholipase family protein [Pseudonocardia hydrocarbonoxydans]|uniref:Patatin family protein n=1 Tax=Pseudonocardia hydrocarbonoxydans TaxID=76726 RepID=A0A4Y3WMU6_9PSEU|nr:patatin-like phospholipase family protein [Pseudonocardia hydrocarbonoxydans]GEC20262.1 patatin family protein [Pseudonocardia hydrocarbonoxydans]